MKKLILYIHGKGGSASEAEHYKPLFSGYDVIGFDYTAQSPREAKTEFPEYFDSVSRGYDTVSIIAVSIGAYFSMGSLCEKKIEKAYLISPVVDMEKLIFHMMTWANVTETELAERKEIPTDFGETLSWEYLSYVRKNPIQWENATHILYGEKDSLTSYETIRDFADKIGASLTVMKDGEHWFHTVEQMKFLDKWIVEKKG